MLKTVKLLCLVAVAVITLSSCSVISSFVPDQDINLMGSQELVMPEMAVQSEPYDFGIDTATLKSQQTASYMPIVMIRNFDDLNESIPLNPQEINQGIRPSKLVLSGASSLGAYPAEVVINLTPSTRIIVYDGGSINVTGMTEFEANQMQFSNDWETAKSTVSAVVAYPNESITFKLLKSATCSLEKCVYTGETTTPASFKIHAGFVDRLMSFIGAGGSDNPKASILLSGNFSTNTDLTGLNFQISLETPPAIAGF